MKRFDSTRPKYGHFFCVRYLLTNFLHRYMLDYTMEIYGDENDYDDMGLDRDL